MFSSPCGGVRIIIYTYIYNKIGERIPCGSVGEKGTHLPVVGHIFQREKERERERERESEILR